MSFLFGHIAIRLCFWTSLVLGFVPLSLASPATTQLVPAFPGLGLNKPTCLVSPPGDTRRLFVCEKETGRIKVIPDVTAASPVSIDFLSLSNLATFDVQGVLGLAFHPNYGPNPETQNTYCYVSYSWSDGSASYSRLSRFTVLNPDAVPAADPASELVLIQQLDRAGFHPGGDLHFGADGYLYISLGDEGFYEDSLNNAQHIDGNFFSAIARIDVDKKPGSVEPNFHPAVQRDAGVARYAVPPDNPFIGATSFNGSPVEPDQVWTEFWAVGFRHPWRFSFDPATGELWCGEVGEDAVEEIDVVTRGGNYGWSFREGTRPGPKNASEPVGFSSIDPIYQVLHHDLPGDPDFQGDSIIGGLFYQGTRIPELTGRYIFGDYITGNIWAAERTANNTIIVQRIAGQTGIAAFGNDPSNGDVLIADNDNDRILRLLATPSTNANLSQLVLSAGMLTPEFASETLNYAGAVSHSITSITVTPTVAETTARVTVNDMPVTSGTPSGNLALSVGANLIRLIVTAQDGTSTRTYTVEVTRQSSLETWRQQYFGTSGNSGTAADAATPDNDGIANLIKYALVIPPGSSGSAFLPSAQALTYADGRRLALVFVRDPSRDDVTIIVEGADSLRGTWMPVATSVNGAAFSGPGSVAETDLAGGLKSVEVRDTVNITETTDRFLHIKVTH